MTLNGWHIGERLVHKKLGHQDYATLNLFRGIQGDLPGDHAQFHCTRLPFLPVTTLDEAGRPWGSILAGGDGKPGFIRNSRYTVLTVDAKVWPGEPIVENGRALLKGGEVMLAAGIGIEFPTRRRNKFAGKVTRMEREGDLVTLDFMVNEAIGNCPKYINARDLGPRPDTSPRIGLRDLQLSPTQRLPDEVVAFIHESDTVFLGTTYHAPEDEAGLYPSHLGMNQRGGRRGFIRVVPSDGRTVVLPDYSGNRFMTSLGNIEATPLASLTFVSFTTGDILYLTGTATNLYGRAAQQIMPFQNTLTTVHTTGYILVHDALPVRQRPGTTPEVSPYSPPIRYLAEEKSAPMLLSDENPTALLTSIVLHTPTIATFTFEGSTTPPIQAGQAAILDFTPLLGAPRYQHMAPGNPASVNDDRIRTWTVSRSSVGGREREFELTMREKPGGFVTGALFNIARKLGSVRPEMLRDMRELGIRLEFVGITGEFVLPAPGENRRMLWVAGGIGITPFLAMLAGLAGQGEDVRLVLSTREPEVFVPLLVSVLRGRERGTEGLGLVVDVFSERPSPDVDVDGVVLRRHTGRVTSAFFADDEFGVEGREVYVCGPEPFEKAVFNALESVGVGRGRVRSEGFAY